MERRALDHEVGMRLLKTLDLVVLTPLAFIPAVLLDRSGLPTAQVLVGFYAIALAFFCVLFVRNSNLYGPRAFFAPLHAMLKTSAAFVLLGEISGVAIQFTGLAFAASWFGIWALGAIIHVAVSRALVALIYRKEAKRGQLKRRIAIVGGGKAAEEAIVTLQRSKGLNLEIVGLFDDRFDNRSPASLRKCKKLGAIADLAEYHRKRPVDLVIVAIPLSAEQRLMQILKRVWELPVDIRVSGQSAQLKLSARAYDYLGELPLLSIFDRPLNHWNQFLKDTLDRFIALCIIILLSPVMAALALAVRFESKGPAIFRQKRFGFNNELIEVFKFRSMYVDKSDTNAVKLVTKGDPRVTSVGRIIRKTSLDELPQLFNVLKGQLSLVGPRPHATQAKAAGGLYDEVVDGYFARHKVKPGITGWAQINGWRGETDTVEKIEQRVKHDLEYINSWSLGLDLYILFKTPFALLKGENAY